MEKFSAFFGLKLPHLIFSATEQLSITLQGRNTTMQEAVESADLAIRFLQSQRNDDIFDRFYSRIIEDSKEHQSLLYHGIDGLQGDLMKTPLTYIGSMMPKLISSNSILKHWSQQVVN